MRCLEEHAIVAGEATEAVAFYQYKQPSGQAVFSGPAWQAFTRPTVDSSPELVEREYVAGHVLQEPKQSSQQLLMQMQSVVEHSTA